jgi:hypothetical protein
LVRFFLVGGLPGWDLSPRSRSSSPKLVIFISSHLGTFCFEAELAKVFFQDKWIRTELVHYTRLYLQLL